MNKRVILAVLALVSLGLAASTAHAQPKGTEKTEATPADAKVKTLGDQKAETDKKDADKAAAEDAETQGDKVKTLDRREFHVRRVVVKKAAADAKAADKRAADQKWTRVKDRIVTKAEDFATVATEESDDPVYGGDKAGDLGFSTLDDMNAEMAKVVGTMTPGEVKEYDAAIGHILVKLEEVREPKAPEVVAVVEPEPEPEPVVATAADVPDEAFEPVPEIDPDVLENITPAANHPYLEHHGYFRFRADAFHNLDLNTTGTSPILPPPEAYLPEGTAAASDAEWYAGSNIRFRYSPTLHLFEDLRIILQLDLPDNLVLGSYPDGVRIGNSPLRPDIPKIAFSGGQLPPGDRYGLRLKQAYGEVKTFFGVIRAGRMASQWGLGILANGGQCIDCDYGDAADRVMFITRALGMYVIAAYDFANEGPVSFHTNDALGQPRDQSQVDDVDQYVGALLYRPLSQEEKDAQTRVLKEDRKPVVNAGLYFVYRSQEGSFEDYRLDATPTPDDLPELEARRAEAYIPDLWVQLLWEPRYRTRLRVELEAAYIYGTIGQIKLPGGDLSNCWGANETAAECTVLERPVRQFGLALESDLKLNQFFSVGLNAGYATGRNAYGFQLNDGVVDAETDPSNFKFDRDYIVDLILFREIIGAVTNATYFKPWVQFDFWTRNNDTFGLNLAGLYALANDAEATPSGESPLGLEFDSMLFYQEEGKFRADLAYGLLLPLSGFKEVEGRQRLTYPGFPEQNFGPGDNRDPEIAQTIQARMFWFF